MGLETSTENRPPADQTCDHCCAPVKDDGDRWKYEIGFWFCPTCKTNYWHTGPMMKAAPDPSPVNVQEEFELCDVHWGTNGCVLATGHNGLHRGDGCTCPNHSKDQPHGPEEGETEWICAATWPISGPNAPLHAGDDTLTQ
jgi:hypothetical protein